MSRNGYKVRPIIATLAGLMLIVALACAGESTTPTSKATSMSPAPVATATSPEPTAAGPTATVPAGSAAIDGSDGSTGSV